MRSEERFKSERYPTRKLSKNRWKAPLCTTPLTTDGNCTCLLAPGNEFQEDTRIPGTGSTVRCGSAARSGNSRFQAFTWKANPNKMFQCSSHLGRWRALEDQIQLSRVTLKCALRGQRKSKQQGGVACLHQITVGLQPTYKGRFRARKLLVVLYPSWATLVGGAMLPLFTKKVKVRIPRSLCEDSEGERGTAAR